MKYGQKYVGSKNFHSGKITRYCKKCNRHVCLSKFTVKSNKKQLHCDYCLGVAIWVEEDV
jgi:hypothetical protein